MATEKQQIINGFGEKIEAEMNRETGGPAVKVEFPRETAPPKPKPKADNA